jgi:hypothetical protein
MPKFSLIREWAKDAASDALSLVDNDLLRYHTMTATTARRVSWELPWQGIPTYALAKEIMEVVHGLTCHGLTFNYFSPRP